MLTQRRKHFSSAPRHWFFTRAVSTLRRTGKDSLPALALRNSIGAALSCPISDEARARWGFPPALLGAATAPAEDPIAEDSFAVRAVPPCRPEIAKLQHSERQGTRALEDDEGRLRTCVANHASNPVSVHSLSKMEHCLSPPWCALRPTSSEARASRKPMPSDCMPSENPVE